MQITTILYTLWVRLGLFILFAVMAIPIFIMVFLVPQRYRYNRFFFIGSAFMYRATLAIMLLPVRVQGKQHLPAGAAIFVANHTSSLDIALLGSLCGLHAHVWLAMTWLTQFFAFRYFLPRVAVLVDMSSPQKGMRSLIKTLRLIKSHAMRVMIFPEGARYEDGTIHPFYAGFAVLAKQSNLPVVPVRIYNAAKAYPPERFWLSREKIHLIVGEPMYCQEDEAEQAFKDRVYQWFVQQDEQ